MKIIKEWIRVGGRLLKIGGPAGSGKSYIIPLIIDIVGEDNCILMTPTGKAATNLQKAGLEAKTIHSVIYHVQGEDEDEDEGFNIFDKNHAKLSQLTKDYEEGDPKFMLKDPNTFDDKQLFIIDEGSMVGGKLLKDILSFNVPVLMVGDPNQLAPVNDTIVYNTCDYYLDEIVRQAAGSPVIWLSQQALHGSIRQGMYGNCMVRKGEPEDGELMYADIVLTDTNKRRFSLNTKMRQLYFNCEVESWLEEGDHVICRSNSPEYRSTMGFMLTNGTQGVVEEIKHRNEVAAEFRMSNLDLGSYTLTGTGYPTKFPPKKRPPKIELGYAITVHLSQGSEWCNVIYDVSSDLTRKSLYTAITRAKESLLITL